VIAEGGPLVITDAKQEVARWEKKIMGLFRHTTDDPTGLTGPDYLAWWGATGALKELLVKISIFENLEDEGD
jgi:hypothetical protein